MVAALRVDCLRSSWVSRPRRLAGPQVSPNRWRPAVVRVRGRETRAQRVALNVGWPPSAARV